jgi:mono/diheme cytochrome c family protein
MDSRHSLVALASRTCVGLTLLIVAACAGNGNGLDANGRPLVPGGSPPPPLSADLASIQANIFTPICSVCHIGGGAPEGLRLDAADSFNLLVGVPSTEVPSLMRVKPGDPDNSYIIQKLEGHAAVGAQMPLGGPYLSISTIAFIRQWITDGAQASAAVPATVHAAAPLAIAAIVPDAAEPVSESPPQIMIAFNHDLDVTQIDTRSMHIEKLQPDASPLVSEIVPARVTVSSANLGALMVWPSRPLLSGHYRLVINAGSPSQFSDIAGHTLVVGAPNELGESVISTFEVEVLP